MWSVEAQTVELGEHEYVLHNYSTERWCLNNVSVRWPHWCLPAADVIGWGNRNSWLFRWFGWKREHSLSKCMEPLVVKLRGEVENGVANESALSSAVAGC